MMQVIWLVIYHSNDFMSVCNEFKNRENEISLNMASVFECLRIDAI